MNATEGEATAGWFETPAGTLFGWFHPAAAKTPRDCAILLCDPFGSDRMNLHLSYRALAIELAAAGFPTLRFDYPGTCDSSGDPGQLARVENWQAAIHHAADWLRTAAGVSELGLFGALLGGTLAMTVAAKRPDVTGLALWGPLPSGRHFLREVRAFAAMTATNPNGRRPSTWNDNDQEAIGFLVPAQMAATLKDLALPDFSGAALRAAAVFRRNQTFPVEPVVRALASGRAPVMVQERAEVDLAELVAERALPPAQLLREMVKWWDGTYPPSISSHPRQAASLPLQPRVDLRQADGRCVSEQALYFGEDGGLFGIVSWDAQAVHPPDVGIVLVNGGSNHRVGINRNYTDWARRWARRGFTVLRMDIRGLGDSPPRHPEELGVLYREETRQDVLAALDGLARTHGVQRFVCMGLCAGGYQSFHAALLDPRIAGVVMLNPLRFRPVAANEAPQADFQYAPVSHYARAWRSPARWRRLLRGEVNVLGIMGSIAHRVTRTAVSRLRAPFDTTPRGTTWLAQQMLALTERECFVDIVFNSNDPVWERAEEELAVDRTRLEATGRFTVTKIDDTDHIFSPLWSQEYLTQVLDGVVDRWLGPPAVSHAAPHRTAETR